MKSLANRIHATGQKAGLWLACKITLTTPLILWSGERKRIHRGLDKKTAGEIEKLKLD